MKTKAKRERKRKIQIKVESNYLNSSNSFLFALFFRFFPPHSHFVRSLKKKKKKKVDIGPEKQK